METANGVIGNFLLLFATLLPLLREWAPTQVPNHPRIIQGGAIRTSHHPNETWCDTVHDDDHEKNTGLPKFGQ